MWTLENCQGGGAGTENKMCCNSEKIIKNLKLVKEPINKIQSILGVASKIGKIKLNIIKESSNKIKNQ